MSGVSLKGFHSILKSSNYNFWWSKCSVFYSVYAPSFKEPILDKKEVDKIIEETSEEEILTCNVKAAVNWKSCSCFYHPDVQKFVHYAMSCGKKKVANQVIRDAFTRIKHIQLRKYNSEIDEEKKKDILINPLQVFLLAVKNVTPMLWYLKIKRSGTWYKVPVGISEDQARRRAMKWIIEVSNDKPKTTPLEIQLANELIAAAQYEGRCIAKKLEMHKLCEANRSNANFWWA